ncbi:ectomycorrhiza-regulated esterase [Crassisporium funariophilum]|nr:ectomycorrhiza-regulated esterase [Crassisporium funariophilum]
MSDRTSTKLFIQHPTERDCNLVGILENLSPNQSTHGRKIALVRETKTRINSLNRHKDYLYQRRLANRLPLDSFRFDLRGNHESGGEKMKLIADLADIQAVVDYLRSTYGYVIELIVAHSRASITSFRWICTTEDGRKLPAFVNLSARYSMDVHAPVGALWKKHLDRKGYFTWKANVAGKEVIGTITPEVVQDFVDWDSSIIWTQFPQATDVLTLHGLSDINVQPYDAVIHARALGKRSPGTHTLHLMEADHNFAGHHDEVVDVILQWLDTRERGELKTGIWDTGIKSRM